MDERPNEVAEYFGRRLPALPRTVYNRSMYVLYPSYSFETLSLERGDTAANELFSAWSAAFHPALIEKFGDVPSWESASYPNITKPSPLIIVPPCCDSFLEADWCERREAEGAVLIRGLVERDEILDRLLEVTGLSDHGFDPEFVADFLALGTTSLVAEVLTRQLRYMSMLDSTRLKTEVDAAIEARRAGETERSRAALTRAFELVGESKEYFYPTDTQLLNLLMVTEKTTAEKLLPELRRERFSSLILPTASLAALAARKPDFLAVLREKLESGGVQLIGNEWRGETNDETPEVFKDKAIDLPLFLLPTMTLADRLSRGIAFYMEKLGRRPWIYGRLQAGLTPVLPQLLQLLGYRGVLHFAPYDGWRLGDENQSLIRWKGLDGTGIDALTRYPVNASDNTAYFDLPGKLGRILDTDSVATVTFAHFPGAPTRWLDDFLRMNAYAPALGEFALIEDYFSKSADAEHPTSYGLEKYRTNALSLAAEQGQTDPISRWTRFFQADFSAQAREALRALTALIRPRSSEDPSDPAASLAQCAESIVRGGDSSRTGLLLINPLCVERTVYLDVSSFERLPKQGGNILLARENRQSDTPDGPLRKEIAVKLPPMGYTWVEEEAVFESSSPSSAEPNANNSSGSSGMLRRLGSLLRPGGKLLQEPPLLEQVEIKLDGGGVERHYRLRNERFELKIDGTSGGIVSLRIPGVRGNRLAQQLALRLPRRDREKDQRAEDDPNFGYTIMAADRFVPESTGPLTGRLRVEGRMVHPEGRTAARFTIRYTIRRAAQVVEIEAELHPETIPWQAGPDTGGSDPWDAYFCVRSAWSDETFTLYGGVHDGHHPIDSEVKLLQLPEFVDLRNETDALTFLTPGLPYHRRIGLRRLDTLLIAGNESARRFRYGFGLDLEEPIDGALAFRLDGETEIGNWALPSTAPKHPSSWLLLIGARNVISLRWEVKEDPKGTLRLRTVLLETEGRTAVFRLRACRPVRRALRRDLQNQETGELELVDGEVRLRMHGREILPIELVF